MGGGRHRSRRLLVVDVSDDIQVIPNPVARLRFAEDVLRIAYCVLKAPLRNTKYAVRPLKPQQSYRIWYDAGSYNEQVPGTVDSVATVATFNQQGNAVFEVVISLNDPTAAAGLDEAPVDVEIVSDSVSGVTAVPVSALVALAEGGYAVEVQQSDGSTVLVAVEPGFYADGLVEVTETQLQPGMTVVVP